MGQACSHIYLKEIVTHETHLLQVDVSLSICEEIPFVEIIYFK